MKSKALMIALAVALLIVPSANAAMVEIVEVPGATFNPGDSFYLDLMLVDVYEATTLTDIYAFSFQLLISGPGNATFEESGETPPFYTPNDYTTMELNYIFHGNSGDCFGANKNRSIFANQN
jgi:hypothetical protein